MADRLFQDAESVRVLGRAGPADPLHQLRSDLVGAGSRSPRRTSYTTRAAAIACAADRNNNVFLFTFSDTDAFGTLHQFRRHLPLCRSRDGGLSWTEPRQPLNSSTPGCRSTQISSFPMIGQRALARGWLNGRTRRRPRPGPRRRRLSRRRHRGRGSQPRSAGRPRVMTDPVLLATIPGRPVFGFAADGVSRVLLGLDVPSAGTGSISTSRARTARTRRGRVARRAGGTSGSTTLGVATHALANNRFVALAVLRAPREFTEDAQQSAGDSDHAIQVSAVFHPAGGGGASSTSRWLVVERPPVVFAHGVWSSAPRRLGRRQQRTREHVASFLGRPIA